MNNEAMKEVLNELFSHLERLETQSEAILQFLKEKKRVTDKQLAPYLEQAGNASSVKWRAARVRIDHLLSPEQPEKETKFGKRPELQEGSSSAASEEKRNASADKKDARVESVDEEGKRTGSGDQPQIDSNDSKDQTTPVKTEQARPTDGNADKPEEKSEVEQKNAVQATQDQHEQKSDSLRHPTEVTEPLAEQEHAEPAAQLNAKEKKGDQEAA